MMHTVPFVILCVLSILGSVGNVFILAAVCLRHKLRVRGNMFVVNLALADLLVTAYIMPVGLMTSQYEVNPFSERVCEFNAFLILTTLGVSTQSLMMIALERYIHICQTRYYEQILKPWICGILVVVCWLYAMIWTSQGWTGWTEYGYASSIYICIFNAASSISYTICLAFFGVILPMIVISVCYYKIFRTVKLSRQKLRNVTVTASDDPILRDLHRRQKKKLRQEHRLVMTLFMIVVIFICFWLPAAILMPLVGFIKDLPSVLFVIAVWTAFTNSCVNSLVYGVMNKNFRDGYKALFRYVCCCGRAMCRGLASHVEQSKDEDTVTTSQHPPLSPTQPASPRQQGSPTASMTTVRTSVSRDSDCNPLRRKSTGRPESLTMENVPNLEDGIGPKSKVVYRKSLTMGSLPNLEDKMRSAPNLDDGIRPASTVVHRKSAERRESLSMGCVANFDDTMALDIGVRATEAIRATGAMGGTDSLRNQDGESAMSEGDTSPWANLQVHDAPRGKNNNIKGNYGAIDNAIKGNGFKDNDKDNMVRDNRLRDNDKDNRNKGNGAKYNGRNNGVRENGRDNGIRDNDNDNLITGNGHRDDYHNPTDGHWNLGQEPPPMDDRDIGLEFDFRKDTNGGILQYCDGDLVMISNV